MNDPSVIANTVYFVCSLIAGEPKIMKKCAGTFACNPEKPPTALSPSGIRMSDITTINSPWIVSLIAAA
jgi:hypothetical protein